MSRRIIHIAVCIVVLSAAALLLMRAMRSHETYATAHAEASQSTKPTGPAPEHFFDQAQGASLAVVALGIVSLVVVVRTRRVEWLICFALCAVMAIVSLFKTGVRY
jgi:cytochrome c-type biogenesis protein CcmE